MRKFRVVDKNDGTMADNSENLYNITSDGRLCYSDMPAPDNMIAQESIDKQDRQDDEIYDGDVVQRFDGSSLYIVQWNQDEIAYRLTRIGSDKKIGAISIDATELTVIGNRYQPQYQAQFKEAQDD